MRQRFLVTETALTLLAIERVVNVFVILSLVEFQQIRSRKLFATIHALEYFLLRIMPVHVPSQCGLKFERALADVTTKWPIVRMGSHVLPKGALLHETCRADVTFERFLSGMNSRVHLQRSYAQELGVTVFAVIRSFTGMDSHVKLQRALLGESFAAKRTGIRSLVVVDPHVYQQVILSIKTGTTHIAFVRSTTDVYLFDVQFQRTKLFECRRAYVAFVRSLDGDVFPQMCLQIIRRFPRFATQFTFVRPFRVVDTLHMIRQRFVVGERFQTCRACEFVRVAVLFVTFQFVRLFERVRTNVAFVQPVSDVTFHVLLQSRFGEFVGTNVALE